ncbi:MAG: catalase family peroxidase [Acidobacteriia bacterium]|nr:catalase family peroxidase [Terriglobia bacterium]
MPTPGGAAARPDPALNEQIVDTLELIFGKHPGFRPAHAKGVLYQGMFTPARTAATLSRAPHLQGSPTPVTVRFSDATGIPQIPDADPNASPHGLAIRFHLAKGAEADIVAHSFNGFPVATAQEFLEFLRALAASGPDAPAPPPIATFLASHPAAARFVAPKPVPTSFASESYYAVNAFRFTNREGKSRYGRYQIHPIAGEQHLDAGTAASLAPNFLFDELARRVTGGPVQLRLVVQLAAEGDPVADASRTWPDDRPTMELGTLSITKPVADSDAAQRKLIFDPTHLADGIEASGDPLLPVRSEVYAISYRRRNQK